MSTVDFVARCAGATPAATAGSATSVAAAWHQASQWHHELPLVVVSRALVGMRPTQRGHLHLPWQLSTGASRQAPLDRRHSTGAWTVLWFTGLSTRLWPSERASTAVQTLRQDFKQSRVPGCRCTSRWKCCSSLRPSPPWPRTSCPSSSPSPGCVVWCSPRPCCAQWSAEGRLHTHLPIKLLPQCVSGMRPPPALTPLRGWICR